MLLLNRDFIRAYSKAENIPFIFNPTGLENQRYLPCWEVYLLEGVENGISSMCQDSVRVLHRDFQPSRFTLTDFYPYKNCPQLAHEYHMDLQDC